MRFTIGDEGDEGKGEEEPEVIRIDSRYICEICGKEARDHPQSKIFPWPTFVKMCDGREVKT